MRYLLIGVGLAVCVAAFAFAAKILVSVLGGAAQDARTLAAINPWLLLLFPAMWAVVWAVGRSG